MSKILITGGAGFIGYHLAKRLSYKHEVVIVDNLSRGRMDDDFKELLIHRNVTLKNVNLTRPETFQKLEKDFNFIYHLAAVIGVKNVEQNPDQVLFVNALSSLYLFEFAKELKNLKKLFFSSTSEIYAGTLKHFGVEVPTNENVPLTLDDIRSPRTTYMLSKMYGEAICFNYKLKYGIPITIGRYHNVYGPRMGFLHVIPEMFYKINISTHIEVSSPEHTRAMCFVNDAVEMSILACESEDTSGEILNIGNSNQEIKIIDLAGLIAKIMEREIKIKRMPDALGSPARRCPDITRFLQLIDYSPLYPLEKGIRLTYDWYKDKLNQKYE